DNQLWAEYTKEVFPELSKDILWRWHYNPDIDNTPRNITPHCLECEDLKPLEYEVTHNKGTSFYLVHFECFVHHHPLYLTLDITPSGKTFDVIAKRIQQRLEDGSWVEVVNKERMARRQAPISPAAPAHHWLRWEQEQILLIISEQD